MTREEAREYIIKHCNLNWDTGTRWNNAMECAVKALEQPERKHGKWVKAKGSWCTPGGDPVWECSECGKGRHVYGVEHGTYGSDVADGQWVSCPNCGADMREFDDGQV